ncbi:MAG TPA: GtrA family protein [Actinokineospora sp.]|jgi:putative flippase GtrA|nr:GtrA family protein [Actinokineospora sp.]
MATIGNGTVGETQRSGLVHQLVRFVLVGGFCALVDSGAYWLLLQAGTWVHLAKALSFIAGTTTAYFLNKRFTFAGADDRGARQAGGFALLYTVTFFVNVGTNAMMLTLLPEFRWKLAAAWVIAQAVATTINFVLLRTVVFRKQSLS